MPTYRASVSFEYMDKAPETYRGDLTFSNPRLAARRAVEAAQKAYPNRRFTSLVVVLEVVKDTEAAA